MRKPDSGLAQLAKSCFATQLGDDFIDLADAGRADGMSLGFQPATDVDRFWAVAASLSFQGCLGAGPFGKEAQILYVQQLCDAKAIMHFGQVDVIRCEPRHRVSLFCRQPGRRQFGQALFAGRSQTVAGLPAP